ncbi:hypothetical protein H8356DRAFT_1348177 [Neocallimastix lanati (nom. inval.)]|nr:hypothetical protein H8356DRAFT_1348177 [Neocallimastix sp. JGI-2020a]
MIGHTINKYDKINYGFADFTGNYEIENFIKLSNKYEHTNFIVGIPNAVESCGKLNYENKISLDSYKKISYKQLMKKKEKSFLKKQEDYMLNRNQK